MIEELGIRMDAHIEESDRRMTRIEASRAESDRRTAQTEALQAENAVQIANNVKLIEDIGIRIEASRAESDRRIMRIEALQAENARRIKELTDEAGSVRGYILERNVIRSAPARLSREFSLRRIRVMHSTDVLTFNSERFVSDVEDAAEAGAIADAEENRLKETDLIARALRKTDGSTLWVAVEASGVINDRDIRRAADSAAALRTVFGEDAIGVVAGHRIRDEDRGRAEDAEVAVMMIERES